jgi:hypothetical protein
MSGIRNEATVSGKACRFAPVAIDELNLSELYVARQLDEDSRDASRGPIHTRGFFLASRQRTDN